MGSVLNVKNIANTKPIAMTAITFWKIAPVTAHIQKIFFMQPVKLNIPKERNKITLTYIFKKNIMNKSTLREIIETAKGLMIQNDKLMQLAKDITLPVLDRSELLNAASYSIDNVNNLLTYFNEKYLKEPA